jgi:hypothetical protein
VAAHLTTTTRETPWDVLRELVRESTDSTRRVVLSSPMDPLMDLVVHAQDIARSLGRNYGSPTEVAVAGRPVGLAALTGDGLPTLESRLT